MQQDVDFTDFNFFFPSDKEGTGDNGAPHPPAGEADGFDFPNFVFGDGATTGGPPTNQEGEPDASPIDFGDVDMNFADMLSEEKAEAANTGEQHSPSGEMSPVTETDPTLPCPQEETKAPSIPTERITSMPPPAIPPSEVSKLSGSGPKEAEKTETRREAPAPVAAVTKSTVASAAVAPLSQGPAGGALQKRQGKSLPTDLELIVKEANRVLQTLEEKEKTTDGNGLNDSVFVAHTSQLQRKTGQIKEEAVNGIGQLQLETTGLLAKMGPCPSLAAFLDDDYSSTPLIHIIPLLTTVLENLLLDP
ncbi:hypothetical protein AGDE_14162 [Angomonas deanei]|uniref:Uncharacterized protein n=1 Tax=Angomonas deanei TaxID=59799 RepID=A0A7G2BZ39_9TRYP|nr:hypothetical protein AGDE_14162 [Angomonas deanei]CAD2212710.1 hypothetical protein, conserved [Angomonas deanei]|eukprot:EPY21326.1 hypothetical protein AGDE_14162 [Angomonas deanei]